MDKQSSTTTEEEALSMAMCMATSHIPSMVFKTVLELNIIDIINNSGPEAQLSPAQIVAQIPTTNPNAAVTLDRLLRLLASFRIFTFSQHVGPDGQPENYYGLGPVCQFMAKTHAEASYTAFANLQHDMILIDTWKHLKDAVLEGGIPFQRAHGMGIFDYLGADSRFNKVFYSGMEHHSIMVSKKILEKYQGFEGISSLVDVGGASGDTLNIIISKHPSIKGINFDLPNVIKDAPSFPGIEHVGGDMYVSVPKADAIFMKWTFHTGSDEQCIKLLKNCHEALPENGKVIICESVVPDELESSYQARLAYTFDTLMMSVPGGKVRTKQEFEALAKSAGFQAFRLICCACDTWLMEILKIRD